MMRLPLKFAFRYLFARKSYNVINLISGIGACGMAVGTAALIIILSVFNGFKQLVSDSLSDAGAALVLRPAEGKFFVPGDAVWDALNAAEDIQAVFPVLEEQAFLSFEGRQSLALVKGVDEASLEDAPLKAHLVDGAWRLRQGEKPQAIAGIGLSHSLGMNPRLVTPLEIHYPSRTQPLSLSNPAASLRSVRVQLAGCLSVNADLDAKMLLVPIGLMRELLECGEEVSALEIRTSHPERIQKMLAKQLGPAFRVLNREEQNPSVFRMMRYEKMAIYLILVFIVIIISFNIYSSLRMLIIEKQNDMETLRSLGAPEALLRRIFLMEGFLVSLLGMLAGLALGILLVLLQARFGLVPMPGNFAIAAYPVVLKASDLFWTVAGVSLIGLLIAFVPSRKI